MNLISSKLFTFVFPGMLDNLSLNLQKHRLTTRLFSYAFGFLWNETETNLPDNYIGIQTHLVEYDRNFPKLHKLVHVGGVLICVTNFYDFFRIISIIFLTFKLKVRKLLVSHKSQQCLLLSNSDYPSKNGKKRQRTNFNFKSKFIH